MTHLKRTKVTRTGFEFNFEKHSHVLRQLWKWKINSQLYYLLYCPYYNVL